MAHRWLLLLFVACQGYNGLAQDTAFRVPIPTPARYGMGGHIVSSLI